jgi:ribonuclease-3
VADADEPRLSRLEQSIGWRFADRDRFLQALTHPSYAHEHPPAGSNEALAFLGDAVLGLVVAERVLRDTPGGAPGPLTQRRAEIVSARGLAQWGTGLDLGGCLRLGRGEEQGGGRTKESVLATALEALVAVLYLEGGLPPVRGLVDRLREDRPTDVE